MSLTKRLNRVPYGRVLFAFVVGVIIIVLLKRTGKTSTYSVKERSYAPITSASAGDAPGPQPMAADSCEMRAGTGLASSLLPSLEFLALSCFFALFISPGNTPHKDGQREQ